jgi:hypothetical protein
MNDSRFGVRGKGEGVYAEAIHSLFANTAERLGLSTQGQDHDEPSTFRRPRGQLAFF